MIAKIIKCFRAKIKCRCCGRQIVQHHIPIGEKGEKALKIDFLKNRNAYFCLSCAEILRDELNKELPKYPPKIIKIDLTPKGLR